MPNLKVGPAGFVNSYYHFVKLVRLRDKLSIITQPKDAHRTMKIEQAIFRTGSFVASFSTLFFSLHPLPQFQIPHYLVYIKVLTFSRS